MTLATLPARWREKAELIKPFAPKVAKAFAEAAADLETAIRDAEVDLLTPRQAAIASGYTAAHVRRLIDEGTIPNAGSPDRPMVRRCDLPRKPGHGIVAAEAMGPALTRSAAIRAIVSQGGAQ